MSLAPIVARVGTVSVDPGHVAFRDGEALRSLGESLPGVEQTVIGESREGRPMLGWSFGHGGRRVSIVAGSHADEPVGPMTAQALPRLLAQGFPDLLERYRFFIVPQMNPDGAARNRPWFANPPDFETYVAHAVREQPGDDIEFGFADEDGARSENRAVTRWLTAHGPFAAHFSLHGMAWAEGAWFLLCAEWAQRAGPLMDALTSLCAQDGFPLHDIDRRGQKGFTRLREGVATTPTSTAMRAFFEAQGDSATAALFRPSSMELAATLGGDPLCMVSELPLFLLQGESSLEDPIFLRFREDLVHARRANSTAALAEQYHITPVPIARQIRYQWGMLVLALYFRAEFS